MIAEKIIHAFEDEIYIPYCLMIDGQFIKYFDEKIHKVVSFETPDPRWVKIKRPYIVVGGELTIEMLDLTYKDEFKYYEAPPQLKANGGVMLIDDFGRQLVSPRDLLNRWIYPLEKKMDYLTLVTGKKIEVPFNQMIIFSSNLNPSDLGDDAFLRRIKYKIEILNPTAEEFQNIFKEQCQKLGIRFSESGFQYLCEKYFTNKKREFRGCHARDLLNHVKDFNQFNKAKPELTKINIDFACSSYFIDQVK
jgi:predicted ATPase with chaperone activity